MYAIRSYYAAPPAGWWPALWVETLARLPLATLFALAALAAVNPALLEAGRLRITSYNVCYTKLLRVLCRTQPPEQPHEEPIRLDPERLRVTAGDRSLELTVVEFQLLHTLYQAPGRIYTRDQLMSRIYDDHRIVSERTIDSHIKKIRRKLAGLVPNRELIHSVYGMGYKYEPEAG